MCLLAITSICSNIHSSQPADTSTAGLLAIQSVHVVLLTPLPSAHRVCRARDKWFAFKSDVCCASAWFLGRGEFWRWLCRSADGSVPFGSIIPKGITQTKNAFSFVFRASWLMVCTPQEHLEIYCANTHKHTHSHPDIIQPVFSVLNALRLDGRGVGGALRLSHWAH